MSTRTRLSISVASLLLLSAAGCGETTRKSTDYSQAYQQGRFAEAQRDAAIAAKHATGDEAEQARLIEGLSAHAAGNAAQALLTLRPLTASTNNQIAGTAGATVGIIEYEHGRYDEAARSLSQAAMRLDGKDAMRARAHAALAYERLGQPDQAAAQRRLAMRAATASDAWDSRVSHRDGSYSIQLGAFSSRTRAANMVEMSRRIASERGLDEPRVVLGQGSAGETLYLVQLGNYPSRASAERAQDALGLTSVIAGASPD